MDFPGGVDVYFLMFLHLGTRRCWISPSTVHPDSAWSCQQTRNFLMHAEDVQLPPNYVLWDNHAKYTAAFDEVFKSIDAEVVKNTPQSPNLRAHVEGIIQTHQVECLDRFVIVSERHLNVINREFQAWYNFDRPHSARYFLPTGWAAEPEPRVSFRLNAVVCETRLGGVLKSYSRRAA